MLVKKIKFVGGPDNKDAHFIIELCFEEGVFSVSCSVQSPTIKMVTLKYKGVNVDEAESCFLEGFQTLIGLKYLVCAEDEGSRQTAFEMLHKSIEKFYLTSLEQFGYAIKGEWEVNSYFKGSSPSDVDEIHIISKKKSAKKNLAPKARVV